jgi:LysR family transcriptional regulator, glycine cleavage system transcriptional activator
MPRLPSLNALRTFEAIARLGSMNDAAEELHVTQSAVSRQLRTLEEELGVLLFRRVHRGLVLTPKGQALAATLGEALDLISEGVERIARSSELLKIRVPPTFGIRWLMPRLSRFETRHPEWTIEVNLVWVNFKPTDRGYDAGIVLGSTSWPDACLTFLFTERITPVCSPAFLEKHGPPKTADHFKALQLLHSQFRSPDPGDWNRWARGWGGGWLDTNRGETFDTLDLSLRAAEAGRGIAMADLVMIEDDLALGRLVLTCPDAVVAGESYYFVETDPGEGSHIALAFREWLLDEARRSTRE